MIHPLDATTRLPNSPAGAAAARATGARVLRLLHSLSSPPPPPSSVLVPRHHSATGHPIGTLATAGSQRSAHDRPPARVHVPGTSIVPLLLRAWRPALSVSPCALPSQNPRRRWWAEAPRVAARPWASLDTPPTRNPSRPLSVTFSPPPKVPSPPLFEF